MSRNISIVMVLLVLVVIAGYLIWLRSRVQAPISPQPTPLVTVAPTIAPEVTASPSATPKGGEATGSVRQRVSTPAGTTR